MSFYDDASLIMYPSGYKEDKIYSLKPTNGTGDLTFSRASTATRLNESGLVESVATGVPRIDYSNGCGSLLLEKQSTNLITYSEDFSNAYWNKAGTVTVSANEITSPDGTQNADKISETTTSAYHGLYTTFTPVAGSATNTVYLKQGTSRYAYLQSWVSTNDRLGVLVDLQTGTVLETNKIGTAITSFNANASIDANGWVRVTNTISGIGTSGLILIGLSNSATPTWSSADGTVQYVGNTANNIYVWGGQVEQSSYPTSYIISNSGTTTTRIADAASKTGISSLINSTEGVLYAEIKGFENDAISRAISISDGTTSNRINLFFSSNQSQVIGRVSSAGVTVADMIYTGITQTTFNKIAVKYKVNDFALWVNGVEVLSDLSGAVPTGLNQVSFDNAATAYFYGNCQNLMVFPSALTDDELADLTGAVHQTFNSLATFYGYTIL